LRFPDTMFQFQHLEHLYTLGLLPLLVLLFVGSIYWRRKKLKKLGDEKLVNEQIRGFIPGRNAFKFILLAVGLSAVIIGWANLQTGDKTEKVERKGIDVIVALDVSKSMLANDIQPDRLTRAKQLIMRMTDKMRNDRVALIVFAGKAYLQVPLTTDFSALKMLLQNVTPDMVPTQGTVIGDAIDMAMQSFTQNERKYKSLIIISDGEDHDETALQKIREAADAGVIVHTVGIGSPQGTTLYDPATKSLKLDENGNPVVSKLNEEELKRLASAGNGSYNLLQNTDEVANKLTDNLANMEQKNLGSVVYTDFTSFFQYFLLAGFIALIIEWLLPGTNRKTKTKKAVDTGKARSIALLLLFISLSVFSNAQTNRFLQQGNKMYEAQRYKEAAADYAKALAKDPTNTAGLFNFGNSLYQQKQFDSSRKVMAATARMSKDKSSKSAANYNIGNTYMSQQKWDEAIDAYKQTLRTNPQDADAKYNLSYAEQMKKKQDQQKQDDKDKKDDKKDNKDKNKDDKQNKDNKDKQDKQDKGEKDKEKEDKGEGDNKDQKDDQDKGQQPQSQPSKLSQQQAEQLLNALQQEEKKLQDKMKKEKGVPVKMQKDW
jgi:Ca-activated chloride channel family protein